MSEITESEVTDHESEVAEPPQELPADDLTSRLLRLLKLDLSLTTLSVLFLLVFVLMSVLAPNHFLTIDNLQSMASQFPELGLLSIAMMISMLTGGIDLSVIGTSNLSALAAALVMTQVADTYLPGASSVVIVGLSLGAAVLVGILCGLFNGFLIGELNITPILATLGTMQLYTGIVVGVTRGEAILNFPELFLAVGQGNAMGIPIQFLVFFGIVALIALVLNRTSFGFKLYMLGTNPIASRFSGINNKMIVYGTYVTCGILSALAGLILIAKTNAAKAGYGSSYLLQSILIVVLGGVNPYGGFGSVWGVVLAVLTLQMVSSGFNLIGIGTFAQDFSWGAVLLIVLVVNWFLIYRHQTDSQS